MRVPAGDPRRWSCDQVAGWVDGVDEGAYDEHQIHFRKMDGKRLCALTDVQMRAMALAVRQRQIKVWRKELAKSLRGRESAVDPGRRS